MSLSTRKKLTGGLSLTLILCLCVGAFAYFTDKDTSQAKATAGTMDLVVNYSGSTWENDIDSFNPGDVAPLDLKLTNNGNKAMDVRQTITVTSDKALTEANREFTLAGSDWTLDEDGSTETKLIYTTADIILNGVGSAAEEVEGGIAGDMGKAYDMDLVFSEDALNDFQNVGVTVDYKAEAKQHENTEAGWSVIAEFETK